MTAPVTNRTPPPVAAWGPAVTLVVAAAEHVGALAGRRHLRVVSEESVDELDLAEALGGVAPLDVLR